MREAKPDSDELMMAKRQADHKSAMELKDLICSLNQDGDDEFISEDELMDLHTNPDVATRLEMAGLNIKDARALFEMLCSISGTQELKIDTFVEQVFQMKGTASSLDLHTLMFEVKDIKETLKLLNVRQMH